MQKYMNGESVKDLDRFLDNLPMAVGYPALAAAGVAWVLAGMSALFAAGEIEKATQLRAELMKVEALQPPVPRVVYSSVSKTQLEQVLKNVNGLYPGITVTASGEGQVTLSGGQVGYYPQFRAAISHIQSVERNWRVSIQDMCMGRECNGGGLSATLKVDLARIDTPAPAAEATGG